MSWRSEPRSRLRRPAGFSGSCCCSVCCACLGLFGLACGLGFGLGGAAAGALVRRPGPVRAHDLLVGCVVEVAHQVTVTFEMPVASMTSCAK